MNENTSAQDLQDAEVIAIREGEEAVKESLEEVSKLNTDIEKLLANPTSRYSLLEGIEIPAEHALKLFQQEMEAIHDPNNSDALLSRMASRIGLNKLIASNNIITNYFLRICNILEVKLSVITYDLKDPSSVRSQDLEVEETGNYTDVQVSALMVNVQKKIQSLLASDEKKDAEVKRLNATIKTKDEELLRLKTELRSIKDAPKKEVPINNTHILTYNDRGKVMYVGVDEKCPSEFTLVAAIRKAKTFPSGEAAINFYIDLILNNRNYNFKGADAVKVSRLYMSSADVDAISPTLKGELADARERVRDYEEFRTSEEGPKPSATSNNFEEEASTDYISNPQDRGIKPQRKMPEKVLPKTANPKKPTLKHATLQSILKKRK